MAEGKSGLTKEEQNAGMVAALLRERGAYLRVGKPERAAEVEEQLRLRGVEEFPDANGTGDPSTEPPQGRSAAPQQTVEADEANQIRAHLEAADVKVDKRWGLERLREELAKLKKD
ncbi:hypothetical protein ACWEF6_02625 [Amycolatopsis sp. NPDC004772]